MKIGKFVEQHLMKIFEYCEAKDLAEFTRLQDQAYSKANFDINYPFCKPAETITQEISRRYWMQEYTVQGVNIRVTNHWFNPPTSNSLYLFRDYLKKCGIASREVSDSRV